MQKLVNRFSQNSVERWHVSALIRPHIRQGQGKCPRCPVVHVPVLAMLPFHRMMRKSIDFRDFRDPADKHAYAGENKTSLAELIQFSQLTMQR